MELVDGWAWVCLLSSCNYLVPCDVRRQVEAAIPTDRCIHYPAIAAESVTYTHVKLFTFSLVVTTRVPLIVRVWKAVIGARMTSKCTSTSLSSRYILFYFVFCSAFSGVTRLWCITFSLIYSILTSNNSRFCEFCWYIALPFSLFLPSEVERWYRSHGQREEQGRRWCSQALIPAAGCPCSAHASPSRDWHTVVEGLLFSHIFVPCGLSFLFAILGKIG